MLYALTHACRHQSLLNGACFNSPQGDPHHHHSFGAFPLHYLSLLAFDSPYGAPDPSPAASNLAAASSAFFGPKFAEMALASARMAEMVARVTAGSVSCLLLWGRRCCCCGGGAVVVVGAALL